jgi:hypothetical protein
MSYTRYTVEQPLITVNKLETADELYSLATSINVEMNCFPQLKGMPIHATLDEDNMLVRDFSDHSKVIAKLGDFLVFSQHSAQPVTYVLVPGDGKEELTVNDIPSQLYFTPILVKQDSSYPGLKTI